MNELRRRGVAIVSTSVHCVRNWIYAALTHLQITQMPHDSSNEALSFMVPNNSSPWRQLYEFRYNTRSQSFISIPDHLGILDELYVARVCGD